MRMERNKEIATSANLADSLTEQQCDVLEWASDMRHVMHKNSEALYDVNAPKHKEIKAFISDTHYSQNPNNLNKRLKDAGLPLIKWSFDDTRIPTNELAMILDNRRLEKSRKRQCIRTLEKANADIENYFAQIDAKYLTFYCPSGNKRVFSNQSKGVSVESRNVTIAEGYTIMGIESLKNNIAYLLHVYAGQISVEDIVSYVNEDIENRIYHMDASMAPQSVHKATNALVETGYIKPDTKELIYINLTKRGDAFVGSYCGTLNKIAASLSILPFNKAHKNDIVYYSYLIGWQRAKRELKPLIPKTVDFISNKIKEKQEMMYTGDDSNYAVEMEQTIIQSMNINSLPVVYEVKQGTSVIAEITTLFGKINVSIINSLFVGSAYTLTIPQYQYTAIIHMADNIDYGKIPYEVQKQLKAVVPELMKLLQ